MNPMMMRPFGPRLRDLTLVGMLLTAAACGDDLGSTPTPPVQPQQPSPPAPVATVEVAPSLLTLAPAETRRLEATLRSAAGDVLSGLPIAWESSDPAVVTVSAGGWIEGLAAGTAVVAAVSGAVRGEVQVDVVLPAPLPTLEALSPATVTAEGPDFTLVITGTGFTRNMWVRIDNAILHPTFVSETELHVRVGANHIMGPATFQVRVLNLPPGGGYSATLPLTVRPHPEARPVPVLSGLSETVLPVGSGPYTLTVFGSDFVNGSLVYVGGWERPTTFVDSHTLQVRLPEEDLARGRDHYLSVVTPRPGGGSSGPLLLRVRPAGG